MNVLRRIYEDFKARRRGETRIVPKDVTRGRIYGRPDEAGGGAVMKAAARPRATIRPTAVIDGRTSERFPLDDWPEHRRTRGY